MLLVVVGALLVVAVAGLMAAMPVRLLSTVLGRVAPCDELFTDPAKAGIVFAVREVALAARLAEALPAEGLDAAVTPKAGIIAVACETAFAAAGPAACAPAVKAGM